MANKNLTQCEIRVAEDNFTECISLIEEAKDKLCKGVESLINMLAKLDKSLLEVETYMSISVIDGELYYGYEVKSVELDEDGTIIINTDNMFDSEQTSFELYHLSHDEIQCLGSILYDAYQKKYGKQMTYKDMVEISKNKKTNC